MLIARVIAEYRASYEVMHGGLTYSASLRGHFHDDSGTSFPKVGDFVSVTLIDTEKAVIEAVEPRRNMIARLAPHDGTVQVMVANVDYLLIVMGLDEDFSIPRLERYLALAAQSDVAPVVVLNKCDLSRDLAVEETFVKALVKGIPVCAVSARSGQYMETLLPFVGEGTTVVLLGSSGAGKSTITNYLLSSHTQLVDTVRERDGRGRHTTTHRQLFVLPTGGFLIDTPGMRELALISNNDAAADAFTDIETLATTCRFNNCDHEKSAGCALIEAVQSGELSVDRFERYIKLQRGSERVRRVRY